MQILHDNAPNARISIHPVEDFALSLQAERQRSCTEFQDEASAAMWCPLAATGGSPSLFIPRGQFYSVRRAVKVFVDCADLGQHVV